MSKKGKKNADPAARSERKKQRAKERFTKSLDNPPHRQFEPGRIYKQESKGDVTKWYKATKQGNLIRVPDPNVKAKIARAKF